MPPAKSLAPCAHWLLEERPRQSGNSQEPKFGWLDASHPLPMPEDGRMPHRASLELLGVTRQIDMHTHWFPETVLRRIWSYFHEHSWDCSYEMDLPRRLDWIRRAGVERFTTLNYAHRPGMASWLNDWTVAFASDVAEAIPFGTFFPEPQAGSYVRRAIEEYGFRGFKLHVRVGGFALDEAMLRPAFEQVAAAGLTMIIHIGSAPTGSEFTAPRFMHWLLDTFPELRVVVAHMGGWEFETYLNLAEQRDNVYLDTTMVFTGFSACDPFPAALLPRLEAVAHKIFFGSDFPFIPYPYAHAIQGILDLNVSDGAKRGMLGENAVRVLGLEHPRRGDATGR